MSKEDIFIERTNGCRFTTARHYALHTDIHTLITDCGLPLETLLLTPERMDEWKEMLDLELAKEGVKVSRMDTVLLHEKNKERCNCFTYLFAQVRNAARSPFPESRKAGRRLLDICKPCFGMQREAFDIITAGIQSLLIHLSKEEPTADLALLDLTRVVQTLEELNDTYIALDMERNSDRALNQLPPVRQTRPKADNCLRKICTLVEASYLVQTDPGIREAIALLIRTINTRIQEAKTIHKISMARSHN